MTKSAWKIPYIDNSIKKKINKFFFLIKTRSRSSMISPEFVGKTFQVYNGIKFIDVKVNESMIGHKLGEFSLTRKQCVHKKFIKKKGIKIKKNIKK